MKEIRLKTPSGKEFIVKGECSFPDSMKITEEVGDKILATIAGQPKTSMTCVVEDEYVEA